MTRRSILVWIGATGATSALGSVASVGCAPGSPSLPRAATSPVAPVATPAPPYFSHEERSVLGALADAVLPPDDEPGGSALGAVDYIENLLTAFTQETPLIYAGGPYSGRNPVPDDPATTSSANDFESFLPLDRVAQRSWALRIYGSAGVPGGGPNDAITGPVVGLREAVASAITQAKTVIPPGVSVSALAATDRASMLQAIDKTTQDAIIELVLEGAFAPPEYGGNTDLGGWKMTHFEGDSLPYGYSTYDTTTGKVDGPTLDRLQHQVGHGPYVLAADPAGKVAVVDRENDHQTHDGPERDLAHDGADAQSGQ